MHGFADRVPEWGFIRVSNEGERDPILIGLQDKEEMIDFRLDVGAQLILSRTEFIVLEVNSDRRYAA